MKQVDIEAILKLNPGMAETDVRRAFELNLDDCVINALKLYEGSRVPLLNTREFSRPLVVGSGNAAVAGKILFKDLDATFADESTYEDIFSAHKDSIDGVYVLSASGSKHSSELTRYFSAGVRVQKVNGEEKKDFSQERVRPTRLITCTADSPAEKELSSEDKKHVIVTPKTTELYTYNTSTYLGWLFSKTGEDPKKIREFIEERVDLPHMGKYESFFVLIPSKFDLIREMFMTKFDELFQPLVSGRVFTEGQAIHAKTITSSPLEMFIGLGYENKRFGNPECRVNVPLPEDVNFAGMMAIGYSILGNIQKQKPSYFKDNIARYCLDFAAKSFGKPLSPVVR